MYVLPGHHETEARISEFCQRFGFKDFHGKRIEIGGFHVAGFGYSNPTPFDTPGEYAEEHRNVMPGNIRDAIGHPNGGVDFVVTSRPALKIVSGSPANPR